jgi:hypothetical protein
MRFSNNVENSMADEILTKFKAELTKFGGTTISEDEWYDRYEPGEPNGDFDDWPKDVDPRCLWTLCDDGDGHDFIISGYSRVNRISFYVTKRPNETGLLMLVPIRIGPRMCED